MFQIQNSKFKILVSLFAIAGAFLPLSALAQANLFLSPPKGVYSIGQLFSVIANVHTGGTAINAVDAQINFDNERLEIASIGYSSSILTLWTEEPNFSNVGGFVRFSGGRPNPGFNGSSGAILRITFKPKKEGNAPVVFSSGAVLANDGKGTNILDAMKGALFTVIFASLPAETKAVSPPPQQAREPAVETVKKTLEAPVITDFPQTLEEGSVLVIRGLGYPNARILISTQKGIEEPTINETFSGSDGRFKFAFREPVKDGIYRIWVKSITSEGLLSETSKIVTIDVQKPLFLRIGSIAVNYGSIIILLLSLLLFLAALFTWFWMRVRKWQERQGKKIAEAEKALHSSFDQLKEGFAGYLRYLMDSKSVIEARKREKKTREELKKELEELEGGVEKEIEDIKKKKI